MSDKIVSLGPIIWRVPRSKWPGHILIGLLGLVLLSTYQSVNAMDDPMRPQTGMSEPFPTIFDKPKAERQEYRLSSILISGKRRQALINGIVLQVGDTVDNAKIRAITPTQVTLRIGGANRTIRLVPLRVKKPLRDTSHE